MVTLARYALSIGAAAVLLAGCGGSLMATGTAQGSAVTRTAEGDQSWVEPNLAKDNLLYVANDYYYTGVTIYKLGSGELVGRLGVSNSNGICNDRSGDIYVTAFEYSIYEFSHRGTQYKKSLYFPGSYIGACSVDQITGNLAVLDYAEGVFLYSKALGMPTNYKNNNIGGYESLTYDDRGNLFVDGGRGTGALQLAELPKGGTTLNTIKLNSTETFPRALAWDGQYLAIGDEKTASIQDFALSGSSATLKRTVTLDNVVTLTGFTISPFGYSKDSFPGPKEIIAADLNDFARLGYVRYWRYPRGGTPIATIYRQVRQPIGVAVSRGEGGL